MSETHLHRSVARVVLCRKEKQAISFVEASEPSGTLAPSRRRACPSSPNGTPARTEPLTDPMRSPADTTPPNTHETSTRQEPVGNADDFFDSNASCATAKETRRSTSWTKLSRSSFCVCERFAPLDPMLHSCSAARYDASRTQEGPVG
eukprot:5402387-Pyramimonas_sp.AAC.1